MFSVVFVRLFVCLFILFVCLLVSRISQKTTQLIITKFDEKVAQGPRKKQYIRFR